ncbi:MAG TPA: hypothetical protein PKY82_10620 [Pyrinomonadaceae bacterium]|nr:hypothetical protein [Pyrinomonadaceae bacterium]
MKYVRLRYINWLSLLFLLFAVKASAQTVDCRRTIRAWELDVSLREFMRTHTCSCPQSDQKPVCVPNNQPDVSPNPTPNPPNVTNVNTAEEQANREAAWNIRKQELLKILKKPDDSGQTVNLPPQTDIYTALREKTAKRIKELNCSAYWGLRAARIALDAKDEITANLDSDFEQARLFGEYSEGAEQGKSLAGCPETKISVPDIPLPLEQNPQIQLFDSMIKDVWSMLPEIISTKTRTKDVKDWRNEIEDNITRNRQEKENLNRKPDTPNNRDEKKKKDTEYDDLVKEALAAEAEAKKLQNKSNIYNEKVSAYQTIYDTVSKEPNRAKEFLPK